MTNKVTDKRAVETAQLANDIIFDIEQNRDSLELVSLKASRLALLLDDEEKAEHFTFIARQVGEIAAYLEVIEPNIDFLHEDHRPFIQIEPFAALISENKSALKQKELRKLHSNKHRLSNIRTDIYKYALNIYYKTHFSGISETTFSRIRIIIDKRLSEVVPEHKEKFFSVYRNIKSENPEDWSNAVHTCRRILQALADKLYPAQDGMTVKRGSKDIGIGSNQYINRLMLYIESKSDSNKFKKIVGTTLDAIGQRLDAVYEATNKGSHETITNVEEAERYVTYTYLLIGDILSL